MKKIIKGISVLLTVCLLLSISGISALAETPENERVKEEQQLAPAEVTVVVDAPPVETPTGQTSTAEAPTAQTSTVEAPTAQTSTAEAPTTQTSTAEASTAQTSAGEASTAQTPTAEASTAQTSDAVVPAEASAPAVNDGTPASEESESKEPASEESESKEPASEEPESEKPASEVDPAEASAPAVNDGTPASEESESKEPASEESESKEPASEEAESEKSASEEPASEESESKEPASEESESENSASEKPESEEPTSEKPASEELESKEPASEEPAGKEPVSEKPDTEQAAAVGGSSAVLRSAELRVGDHMITVTGELPEGTELKVVKIPDDIVAAMAGKITLFSYDICLLVDGQVWQPEDYDKDVEVTICDAAEKNREDRVSILHVKKSVIDGEGRLSEDALAAALKGLNDGSVGKENLSTDKNANRFSFKTSSFSMFLAQSYLLVSNSENTGSSEENGIVLDDEGNFDILITGTLETGGTPVLISDSVTPENVSITVWKIDGAVKDEKGEEHVVAEGTPGEEQKKITEASSKVEESIHYIIRVEPSQEDIIGLSGTEKVHGYDTATEGSTVTLKVKVPDGYTLTGAYNGEGEKIALEKDPDGNYYVEVPRGGGVYLSVELEKDEDHDTDWGDWSYTWSPCSEKNEDKDRFCIVSFDFNGGTLNGSAGPVFTRVEIGETVTLLDAPTRPGYRFVRWASSPEVSVSMPGESFTLTECVRFVAVWDGPAWPVGGDHDDDDDDDDDDEDEGPDVTETVRIDQDSDEELNLSSVRVTGEKATGIEILSATQEIDVDRDVTVKGGTGGAAGIDITAAGRAVTDEVEIGDGMTVSAAGGNAAGIQTAASAGGQIDLLIQGDTGVSSDSGTSTGIAASADSTSGVAIVIEGDLITKG